MEELHGDEMHHIARQLTGNSLHAFFSVSKTANKGSQHHIQEVQSLANNEFLARIFNCRDATVIDQTLAAVVEFINYHVPHVNFVPDNLAGSIRLNIANRIQPNGVRELMPHFRPMANLGDQKLLRMNATMGMPNIQTHHLSDFQISIALTMVAITLAFVSPLDRKTNVKNMVDNWIVYHVYNNQESLRLAENVALQIRHWTEPNPNMMRRSPSKL